MFQFPKILIEARFVGSVRLINAVVSRVFVQKKMSVFPLFGHFYFFSKFFSKFRRRLEKGTGEADFWSRSAR